VAISITKGGIKGLAMNLQKMIMIVNITERNIHNTMGRAHKDMILANLDAEIIGVTVKVVIKVKYEKEDVIVVVKDD
jgi:hypothetical protein